VTVARSSRAVVQVRGLEETRVGQEAGVAGSGQLLRGVEGSGVRRGCALGAPVPDVRTAGKGNR